MEYWSDGKKSRNSGSDTPVPRFLGAYGAAFIRLTVLASFILDTNAAG